MKPILIWSLIFLGQPKPINHQEQKWGLTKGLRIFSPQFPPLHCQNLFLFMKNQECGVPSRTGQWGSRGALPTFVCWTSCYGPGIWSLSNVFVPWGQGTSSFIYPFSFCKSASLFSCIPRCGDVSCLETALLHSILFTCLGTVSLKQKLSQ